MVQKSNFTLFDTTLRDGEQSECITFTVQDKLKITRLLDEFGFHYIEGGWPGSNPKAVEFFNAAKTLKLRHAKLTAFGSTHHPKNEVQADPNINALLESETPVVAIFGKSWDFHVTHALKISLDRNLEMIYNTVRFLKDHGREVIYDAEHFFDGYKKNKDYAQKTIQAAVKGGASIICLCDTNGGCLPAEIFEIVSEVIPTADVTFGFHGHNDSGVAVANSIMAIDAGVKHIQGTINGYGERCGNANLCSIIPIMMLKKGIQVVSDKQLQTLTSLSKHIDEIANINPLKSLPFVGDSSFAHKGGIHVSAVLKYAETYEHIQPEKVGNKQRVLVSELSGASNLLYKAKEYGIDIESKDPAVKNLLKTIKQLENEGYSFEDAEASFEILLYRSLNRYTPVINLESFRVIDEKRGNQKVDIEATIKAKVGKEFVHTAAEGNGPVSALDHALRKILIKSYPEIEFMHLIDYKVRVLNAKDSSNAKVRVLVESRDHEKTWGTVGVSENIIEASWHALVDSYEYKLLKTD